MPKQYRIKRRKYSSNVIEKLEVRNGKEKWKVYICPCTNKEEGDKIAEKLLLFLNSN